MELCTPMSMQDLQILVDQIGMVCNVSLLAGIVVGMMLGTSWIYGIPVFYRFCRRIIKVT